MIKILAIGNSFSQDATRYLEGMAGGALFVRNCYIGGCGLQRHHKNMQTDAKAYEYQKDANCLRMISLSQALADQDWDYVTIQQVSGSSGKYDSYEPYTGELIAYIKEKAPQAKIVLHRTWPYQVGSFHRHFGNYGCDHHAMQQAIVRTTDRVATHYGIPIIAAGDAVYKASSLPSFNVQQGGTSLYRDTYHLGYVYGRYLAALCWYRFFTGNSAHTVTLLPDGADAALLAELKSVVG